MLLLHLRIASDGVVIAKVDADAHRDLGGKFGVSGFPTIKWFPKGSSEPEDFNGDRSAAGIVKVGFLPLARVQLVLVAPVHGCARSCLCLLLP